MQAHGAKEPPVMMRMSLEGRVAQLWDRGRLARRARARILDGRSASKRELQENERIHRSPR